MLMEEHYPKRKNPRIKGYDYSTPNSYFITICTHEKQCIFWTEEQLNSYGQIAYEAIHMISEHYPQNIVEQFAVMPNHVHMILTVEPGGSDISTVVGSYKSYVTKKIHELSPNRKVWQVSFHDHGIRNQRSYEKIFNYIETNPLKWKEDCFYMVADR